MQTCASIFSASIAPRMRQLPLLAYILGSQMSEKIIAFLVEFVTHVIDAGGYAGIIALMGIESACIPLPSEIILPFAGYLVFLGRFGVGNQWAGLAWVATAGAVGCNLGSAVAYWIGARGGRPLVERYGKWVLMSHHDLDWMTVFFERYGSITVLVARLLPVAGFIWFVWERVKRARQVQSA